MNKKGLIAFGVRENGMIRDDQSMKLSYHPGIRMIIEYFYLDVRTPRNRLAF
jgi:hypothetical protein